MQNLRGMGQNIVVTIQVPTPSLLIEIRAERAQIHHGARALV